MMSYLWYLLGYDNVDDFEQEEEDEEPEVVWKSITKYVEPTSWSGKNWAYYFPGQPF
jgi:hypothetical protein